MHTKTVSFVTAGSTRKGATEARTEEDLVLIAIAGAVKVRSAQ